jgi:nicotinamide riboside kinase
MAAVQKQAIVNRFVLTGPESTGKSLLADALAGHFSGISIPEYARDYIAGLNRPYTAEDVLEIARVQYEQYTESMGQRVPVFFDTWLIITRIWLEVVYGTSFDWINKSLRESNIDLYLLCYPDIPWEPDPLREHGGEMRNRLYEMYLATLEEYGLPYRIIRGSGQDRINNAIFAVKEFIKT